MQRCPVKLRVENQFRFLGTYYFYFTEKNILNLKTNIKCRLRIVILECLLCDTTVLH